MFICTGYVDESIPIDGDEVIDDALGAGRGWQLLSTRSGRLRLRSGLWNEDRRRWPWSEEERIGVPFVASCGLRGGSRR